MNTREIPSSEWFDYFGHFSKKHAGRLATLRILTDEFGAQVEARRLPLEGIVSTHEKSSAIAIDLGRGVSTHIEHTVPDPARVWAQFGDDGEEAAIDIESKDGTRTILEILPKSPPAG